jgi:hypothetical protein
MTTLEKIAALKAAHDAAVTEFAEMGVIEQPDQPVGGFKMTEEDVALFFHLRRHEAIERLKNA